MYPIQSPHVLETYWGEEGWEQIVTMPEEYRSHYRGYGGMLVGLDIEELPYGTLIKDVRGEFYYKALDPASGEARYRPIPSELREKLKLDSEFFLRIIGAMTLTIGSPMKEEELSVVYFQ